MASYERNNWKIKKTKSDLLHQEIKVDKTIIQNPQVLKDSTNILLLLDQNWEKQFPRLQKNFKTF